MNFKCVVWTMFEGDFRTKCSVRTFYVAHSYPHCIRVFELQLKICEDFNSKICFLNYEFCLEPGKGSFTWKVGFCLILELSRMWKLISLKVILQILNRG